MIVSFFLWSPNIQVIYRVINILFLMCSISYLDNKLHVVVYCQDKQVLSDCDKID